MSYMYMYKKKFEDNKHRGNQTGRKSKKDRQYIMAKRKRTKLQTIIHKILTQKTKRLSNKNHTKNRR